MAKETKATKQEPTEVYVLKKAKAKAGKKGEYSVELEFDRVETDENGVVTVTPVSEEPPHTPHMDFFTALKRLVPHWAIDAEEREAKDFKKAYFEENEAEKDASLEGRFKVTGISMREKGGQRFATLFGRKVLKTGKVINHSPTFGIDDEESKYLHNEFLKRDVLHFISEVNEYMGGKKAPNAQLQMEGKGFPNEGSSTEEQPINTKVKKVS